LKSFNTLVNIIKTIGFYNFIKSESKFKGKKNREDFNRGKSLVKGPSVSVTESLINFFLSDILTDQEKVTLKKFEFTSNKALAKKYKNTLTKKLSIAN
jgi:hypothetical protein